MSTSSRKRRAQSDIRGADAHSPPQRRRTQNGQTPKSRNRGRARDDVDEEEVLEDEDEAEVTDHEKDQEQVTTDVMVKGLVRMALAHEFSRTPIRRTDMSKVLGSGSRKFQEVFIRAQEELRKVFGMEMVELPLREKTKLSQRRAPQSSDKSSSSKSYILVSTLPTEYRLPTILVPTTPKDAAYQGLVSFVVALIYLSGRILSVRNLERYLNQMDVDEHYADKTLSQMQRHGYIVKVKDTTADIGDVTPFEYHLGPRAKMEIGEDGLKRLVRSVFGEDAPEDLDARIKMNIGVETQNIVVEDDVAGADDHVGAVAKKAPTNTRKKKKPVKRQGGDDDDDDGYE